MSGEYLFGNRIVDVEEVKKPKAQSVFGLKRPISKATIIQGCEERIVKEVYVSENLFGDGPVVASEEKQEPVYGKSFNKYATAYTKKEQTSDKICIEDNIFDESDIIPIKRSQPVVAKKRTEPIPIPGLNAQSENIFGDDEDEITVVKEEELFDDTSLYSNDQSVCFDDDVEETEEEEAVVDNEEPNHSDIIEETTNTLEH